MISQELAAKIPPGLVLFIIQTRVICEKCIGKAIEIYNIDEPDLSNLEEFIKFYWKFRNESGFKDFRSEIEPDKCLKTYLDQSKMKPN